MRHWYGTIASIWLSLLLVWTGAGIGLLHCSHTGQTEALQLSADACQKSCCHAKAQGTHTHHAQRKHTGASYAKPSCMSLEVVKLSPSLRAPHPLHSLAPLAVPLALFQQPLSQLHAMPALPVRPMTQGWSWHGPPRSWLTFIRILII